MNTELEGLVNNHTWNITELPPTRKLLNVSDRDKVKLYSDGSVERCKARLVAKGYTRELGEDYYEVFSPVANLVTVRVFIAVVTAHSWPLYQLDINNVFMDS